MWDLIAVCSEKEREYSLTAQLHSWARELNSLAQAGLTYCKDPFDHERYERLGDLAAQMAAYYVDEQAEVIRKQWLTLFLMIKAVSSWSKSSALRSGMCQVAGAMKIRPL